MLAITWNIENLRSGIRNVFQNQFELTSLSIILICKPKNSRFGFLSQNLGFKWRKHEIEFKLKLFPRFHFSPGIV